jgi:hypothetical protein
MLLVGSNGAPGGAKDLPSGQVRLSWAVAEGDNPSLVLRDVAGEVVDRYPGSCPGVTADGPLWLLDLPSLGAGVTRVDLSVVFRASGYAGFEAIVGGRTLSHPGAVGQPGQERLLARLTRTATGWSLVPFDRPVDADAGPLTTSAPAPTSAPVTGRPGTVTAALPRPPAAPDDTRSRTGRLLVVVDASSSMVAPLRSGAVAAAVLEAIQASGVPEVVLRADGGVRGATRLGATTVSADIATFCAALASEARRTRSGVLDAVTAAAADDDEVVVVSDAAPADVGAVRDVLAGRRARWIVVGPDAVTSFGPDRARLTALGEAGVRVRTFAAG